MSFAEVDYHLFQYINQLSNNLSFLNPMMCNLATKAEYVFYLGVVVYWFTRQKANRDMVAKSLLSASIALGLSGMLGHFFYRDRPFVTHEVLQLIPHPANASFPSDHATAAFAIAASIWMYRRKAGTFWFVLAASIAFSRVWTGVHYVSDVMAGAIIGISVAWTVHQLSHRYGWLSKGLNGIIHVYEHVESKIWHRKETKQG
ncbi:undecaprenyl-diphosphatase [Paenibacillus roseipurpureus]|uniref:Undecaprenyl-diphosphatase n=1 Tax=Paenibacillus roseopurpureus TaxID=2918901 RepID=A0AA96LJM9_9BACL|nr:undecaprenyl-diphosphatase [Paenibacillus sp. MBLB1832]WNR43112.1 undecaprenyl-diphosphatase [Paenibacillus sp. MBLB1832]